MWKSLEELSFKPHFFLVQERVTSRVHEWGSLDVCVKLAWLLSKIAILSLFIQGTVNADENRCNGHICWPFQ